MMLDTVQQKSPTEERILFTNPILEIRWYDYRKVGQLAHPFRVY